MTNVKFDLSKL